MFKRIVLGLFFVLMPGVAWAQTQEDYLPAKSQLYFRWDGMAMHQAAFDKTGCGKMLKGETGKFLDELWKYIGDNVQTLAQNEPKVAPMLKDFGKLVSTMHQNGLVVGVEANQINPPKVQAVLVFPKGAGESGTLIPLIQKVAEETKAPVKATKVGKRFVNTVSVEVLQIGWWSQGQDAVLFLGTTDPVAYAKDIDGSKTGLGKHSLYTKVKNFKEFTSASRGYFDMPSVLGVVSDFAPPAAKIIDETGLNGIKGITFYSGFDGAGERSVVEADIPSPRKGLLTLASQKKISLKDLPVLPNDITNFSASTISLNKSYGVITNLVDGIVRVFDPNQADNIRETIKAFEGAIGVDLEKELFGNFGDVMVTYNSPSDGFLGTGAVVAVQLKDAKKLEATIAKLVKAVGANPAGELSMKKKNYHGGEIMQLSLAGPVTNAHIATIGVYKNWFVYAQYPQPIKGFILRQEGELPAWKADDSLNKVLADFPKEFTAIQVSDPRPTVQTLLSITPFVINLANSVGGPLLPGYRAFDLELIPHAQYATKHLFPNVTISTDDGKRVRTETRGSLLLPF